MTNDIVVICDIVISTEWQRDGYARATSSADLIETLPSASHVSALGSGSAMSSPGTAHRIAYLTEPAPDTTPM